MLKMFGGNNEFFYQFILAGETISKITGIRERKYCSEK